MTALDQKSLASADLDAEVDRCERSWRVAIEAVSGLHRAIEVLWDGDTQGWYLTVALVTERDAATGGFDTHPLDTPCYGGDIRVFLGMREWPEARVVRRAGARTAAALGLAFYFPSPDVPDDDCPHWWERDAGVRCRSCDKPLVSDRGAHLPVDQTH